MTLDELQAILHDQEVFKKAFRKEVAQTLLTGKFSPGRASFIHQFVFPDGSQLRLKFYDTVKQILNTKGQPVYGKESFLSYMEVTVLPIGQKAYCYSVDVKQVVWGTSKSKAAIVHAEAKTNLTEIAATLGIDLSTPTAWATTYTENY